MRKQYRVEQNSKIELETDDKERAYALAEQLHRIFPRRFHEVYRWDEEDNIYHGIFQLAPGDCWKCHRSEGHCKCDKDEKEVIEW